MKNYFILFMLTLTCCMLFEGCNNHSPQSQTGKQSVENTQMETTAPSPTDTAEPRPDDYNVCFIGNSLIDYGCQARFLKDIALSYGKQISVDQLTWGGSFLHDYVDGKYMSKKEVKKRLKKADIVVFQDYGGWNGQDTIQAIKNLEKWCNKQAKFFYYMYEDDEKEMSKNDYKQLKKLGMRFIPKGQTINSLYDMAYSYEELHVKNDFHPNNLNGYIAALVMHGVIFKEKCADFPKEWFSIDKAEQLTGSLEHVMECLHGNSPQETWEEFQRICQKADEFISQAEEL